MNTYPQPISLTGFSALVNLSTTGFKLEGNGVFGQLETAVSSIKSLTPSTDIPPGCSIRWAETEATNTILVKGDTQNPLATLYFYLLGSDYTLLGIAFTGVPTMHIPVGRAQVPSYEIQRDERYSLLTLQFKTDSRWETWNYGILIQRVADGVIGIYDPTIENEE